MTKSLQDILKQRQQEEFVGREEQQAFFENNLALAPDDPRRRFVISISGQGGVGKTWLLRRFRKMAEEAGAVTACTDETEEDTSSVMGRIAEQFEAQDYPLKSFAERYKIYLQRRQEIEADPEALSAFPDRLGRALTKGGLDLVRIAPGASAVVELLDQETLVRKGGDFAAFVARKVKSRADVRLLLEPAEILTPLLLNDLRKVAEERPWALFFDTYERIGTFLDPWLCNLLEGRYGNMPTNLLLVIAGRDEVDRNRWAPYQGLLARISLEPFTENEARDYLTRQAITDQRVVDVILHLSGRLPLLIATLAAESPDDPDKVGDPSGEAVERFLKWVEDPSRQRVALDAALLRQLNRDILAVLVGEEQADAHFSWLRGMPFVQRQGDGWAYHDVARTQMLRYKRQEAPQGWAELHGRVAEYYRGLRDDLGLQEEAGRRDEVWQAYALEALYHTLCQAPQKQLPEALNGFLAVLKTRRTFARRWAEIMHQAGKDVNSAEVQDWGERMVEGLRAYDEDRYEAAVEMLTALLKRTDLEERLRPVALDWRGYLYALDDQYSKALTDQTEAIRLAPQEAEYSADRGETCRLMERYEEALPDFDRAIELDPNYAWAIVSRGLTYRALEQHEEALADFDRAVELDPDDVWAIGGRGLTYRALERHEEALADFDRAIELEPDYAWAIASRGLTYRALEQHEEALADFDQTLELKPDLALAIASRGETYRLMERYEEALADFDRAIELDPDYAWAIASRGLTYRLMERYEETLADFDRTLELKPDFALAIASRGETYWLMERYEEALADFDRAIELEPDDATAIASRGRVYRALERYEEALADFDRAIELDPDLAWAIASRGQVYQALERYEEALPDFDQAIELDPDYAWAIASRGQTYGLMGRYEEALADFDRAIELEPDDALAIASRGLTYRLMERDEEALADFDRAIELDPDLALAIASRGETYRLMERYEEALADFDRAIELEPDDAAAIAGRGRVYRALERYEEALADFDRAIELDPDLAWAIASRGQVYQALERYEETLPDFDRVIELDPDLAWAIASRGETYRLMERYEEALADFDRAIELEPDVLDAYRERALAHRQLGNTEAALADFCRYLELRPDADDRETVEEWITELEARLSEP